MTANAGTPRARALSAALREAREASGVGVRALARQLEISPTQVSHWETGKRVPGVESVAMVLTALRVSAGERERVLDLARNARDPNWLAVGLSDIPQQLAGAIECERAASSIAEWSPMAVPGILQTSDYSRAIMHANDLPSHDIDIRFMVRAGRSEALTGSAPTELEALLSEAVLREPVGSPHIMRTQLDHLASMGKRPNVTIRVMPLRIGWHPGWSGPFLLYDFPDTPPVLHFEHHSSGAFIPTEHDVREYRVALAKMRDIAFDPNASIDYIECVRDEWDGV